MEGNKEILNDDSKLNNNLREKKLKLILSKEVIFMKDKSTNNIIKVSSYF